MKKTLMAMIALLAVGGFAAYAADAAAGGDHKDKPKHERKTFEQLDADKDGKVTMAELKAGYPDGNAERLEGMFKKKDANSDGSLSKEEYDAKREHKDGGGDKAK